MNKFEVKDATCCICHNYGQCAMKVSIKDGEIIKVEGDVDSPRTKGILCSRGAAIRQYIYDENRIKYPLKRIGPKGSGKFKRISWEEAYNTIAENLEYYRSSNGARSLAFYAGYSKWYRPILARLASCFGSPNYINESGTCSTATDFAWELVFGTSLRADISNSKLILVWSRNIHWTDIAKIEELEKRLNSGTKMIVVDPRITPLSQKANIHLRIKPGTDGALALGMAKVIIEENLQDKSFIREYVHGYKEFKDYLNTLSLAKIESITGIKVKKIKESARLYAKIKPASIMTSASPVVHHVNGVQNYRAVMTLVALTGNFDVLGGNIALVQNYKDNKPLFELNYGKLLDRSQIKDLGMGEREFPIWRELEPTAAQSVKLSDYIMGESLYEIKGLFALGLNHMIWGDSNRTLEALKKLEFLAVGDLFMTEAAKYADIVLPVSSGFERAEIKNFGNCLLGQKQVIEPLGESKHDVEIILELARYLNLKDKYLNMSYEEYMDFILEPTGVTSKELFNQKNVIPKNLKAYKERKYLKERLRTPSGKVEIYSNLLAKYEEEFNLDPLPKYRPFYEIYPEYKSLKNYPLILNTGSRKPHMLHSRTYRSQWIRQLEPIDSITINPEDAKKYDIKEGDKVKLSTFKGYIIRSAHISVEALKGVVFVYHGNKKSDVNTLIDKDYLDPISGFPGYKSIPCKIERFEGDINGS